MGSTIKHKILTQNVSVAGDVDDTRHCCNCAYGLLAGSTDRGIWSLLLLMFEVWPTVLADFAPVHYIRGYITCIGNSSLITCFRPSPQYTVH